MPLHAAASLLASRDRRLLEEAHAPSMRRALVSPGAAAHRGRLVDDGLALPPAGRLAAPRRRCRRRHARRSCERAALGHGVGRRRVLVVGQVLVLLLWRRLRLDDAGDVEVEDGGRHAAHCHAHHHVRLGRDRPLRRRHRQELGRELAGEVEAEEHHVVLVGVGQYHQALDGGAHGDVAEHQPLPAHHHRLVRDRHQLRQRQRPHRPFRRRVRVGVVALSVELDDAHVAADHADRHRPCVHLGLQRVEDPAQRDLNARVQLAVGVVEARHDVEPKGRRVQRLDLGQVQVVLKLRGPVVCERVVLDRGGHEPDWRPLKAPFAVLVVPRVRDRDVQVRLEGLQRLPHQTQHNLLASVDDSSCWRELADVENDWEAEFARGDDVLVAQHQVHLLADLEVALAGLADKELVLQDHVQRQLLDPLEVLVDPVLGLVLVVARILEQEIQREDPRVLDADDAD
mmetsp:Transcript_4511/g.10591  ORF Transcript_4511/g.10591 Transcript_4511/m.10591 type:complete len:456 (-) Transcript_4511:184-1551(-)